MNLMFEKTKNGIANLLLSYLNKIFIMRAPGYLRRCHNDQVYVNDARQRVIFPNYQLRQLL